MKIYTISRHSGRQVGCTVATSEKLGPSTYGNTSYILPHCICHSPTGFETGYGGSGPADLALSILADYFGVSPKRITAIYRKAWGYDDSVDRKPLKLHQDFKARFIAPRQIAENESYEILGAEIASWLGDLERPAATA